MRERIRSSDGLAPRRIEILNLLALGFCYKEIAEKLGISPGRVRGLVSRTLLALGVESSAQAVFKAVEMGVIDLEKTTAGFDLESVRSLTKKEQDILRALTRECAARSTSKEIAASVSNALSTVKNYFGRIHETLGTNGRIQAGLVFMAAERKGLVE